jgi:hypothetical protein
MTCTPACLHPRGRQAHCGSCHQTFGGLKGFDAHRRRGVCVLPTELGMVADPRGVWHSPMGERRGWWER